RVRKLVIPADPLHSRHQRTGSPLPQQQASPRNRGGVSMSSVHHQPGPRRRVTKGLALLTACGLTFSACGSRNDQNAGTQKPAEPVPAAAAAQPDNPTAEAPQSPAESGNATPAP